MRLRARTTATHAVRKAGTVAAVTALAATAAVAGTTTSADAASGRTWDKLAQCESGGNWHINSTYDGGLQFSPSTWIAYGGGKYASYAYQASRVEQITIAEKTLRGSGWGAWPSCSAALGLTQADANEPFEGTAQAEPNAPLLKHKGSVKMRSFKLFSVSFKVAVPS